MFRILRSAYGIDTDSGSGLAELAAGPVKTMPLLLDKDNATVAKGQVLKYDDSANNFVNRASGITDGPYAVCAETKTITEDTYVTCIVAGDVVFESLDATSQAEADTKAALLKSGIFARNQLKV